ncbi:hypothetical protein [Novosphingobium kaempferiae]|uniref:hypothetical protein n=1 Tax=Novosphingobium kaempferiae TaxID=2896849 RepID=UPI001E2D3F7D|nr:hypothetical protein [Novosphingobium kaempferiae]
MKGGTLTRGHPLFALLALLAGWAGGRAATWEPQAAQATAAVPDTYVAGAQSMPGSGASYPGSYEAMTVGEPGTPSLVRYIVQAVPSWSAQPAIHSTLRPFPETSGLSHLRQGFAEIEELPKFYAPEVVGTTPASPPGSPIAPQRQRRWSMDAWAMLRRDDMGAPSPAGLLPATYGASQAGGVLRYRLALGNAHRPTVYLRSTSSTGMIRETAAALGLSARPIIAIPVVAALEGRVTDQGGQRRIQGAAMAITELPPFRLPLGLRGEAYAQAGYVAGRYATPFVDGQFRADRRLVRLGSVDARLGAGVWGGAQKGAARLDAGPSASVAMPLGRGMNGRVAVDWRFRLAGDAVPGSGPAVTLSAGF